MELVVFAPDTLEVHRLVGPEVRFFQTRLASVICRTCMTFDVVHPGQRRICDSLPDGPPLGRWSRRMNSG